MWELNACMVLDGKELQEPLEAMKPEDAPRRETEVWKVADVKALAIVAQMPSPAYQSMIRNANSANEAWDTLRKFCETITSQPRAIKERAAKNC
ncbi:uncharacterized protein PHALS_06981 [Plasmopara halstedii]|uniref:Uncharacterized protein n=1 Tax=Plasmopara halstedii TaxID=4781 RepID=A0A0P1B588_PLAHL|nr:uncharacterized protein PHALS_06981 [Plasmopara halstedii]CEG49207.1 hypothetical protein PHALS_06981 [Plasmopara halstedii]|eukprot:XP_024585576.1 hypothetical protein PHALS_06981 [Plasmopara halstedii]